MSARVWRALHGLLFFSSCLRFWKWTTADFIDFLYFLPFRRPGLGSVRLRRRGMRLRWPIFLIKLTPAVVLGLFQRACSSGWNSHGASGPRSQAVDDRLFPSAQR